METRNLWDKSLDIVIQTPDEIVGGFDVGFDDRIPEETKDALMKFVYWAEDHYHFPVTLWVDFEYKHYLISREKKRAGYLFYWVDYIPGTPFEREEDIPVIRLPVRMEKWTMEDILLDLIRGITSYFAWLNGAPMAEYDPDEALVEAILARYRADS